MESNLSNPKSVYKSDVFGAFLIVTVVISILFAMIAALLGLGEAGKYYGGAVGAAVGAGFTLLRSRPWTHMLLVVYAILFQYALVSLCRTIFSKKTNPQQKIAQPLPRYDG